MLGRYCKYLKVIPVFVIGKYLSDAIGGIDIRYKPTHWLCVFGVRTILNLRFGNE